MEIKLSESEKKNDGWLEKKIYLKKHFQHLRKPRKQFFPIFKNKFLNFCKNIYLIKRRSPFQS